MEELEDGACGICRPPISIPTAPGNVEKLPHLTCRVFFKGGMQAVPKGLNKALASNAMVPDRPRHGRGDWPSALESFVVLVGHHEGCSRGSHEAASMANVGAAWRRLIPRAHRNACVCMRRPA